MSLDGEIPRRSPAIVGMAVPPGHLRAPRGRRCDRAHACAVRDYARMPGSRHSRIPLHDREGGWRRHPLRALRDVRHAGAVGSRRAGARRPPRVSSRESRDDRDRRQPRSRACARRRSRDAVRDVLARAAGRRARTALRCEKWRLVLEKFATYGQPARRGASARSAGPRHAPPAPARRRTACRRNAARYPCPYPARSRVPPAFHTVRSRR